MHKTSLERVFMYAPSFIVCARLMSCVCMHMRSQLSGNIGHEACGITRCLVMC